MGCRSAAYNAAMPGSSCVSRVLFGGPSPEHDVSILTGLQAARALAAEDAVAAVHDVYWTKTADWLEVSRVRWRPAPSSGGAPEARRTGRSGTGPDGGLRTRTAWRRAHVGTACRDRCRDRLLPWRSGGGRHAPGDARLRARRVQRAERRLGGAWDGQARDDRGARSRRGADAATSRTACRDGRAELRWPVHRQAAFGGSSIGIDVVRDWPTALARLGTNVHLRQGAVLEPYRGDLYDLQVAVRTWPETVLSAFERPLGTPQRWRDPRIRGQIRRWRRNAQRARGAASADRPRIGAGAARGRVPDRGGCSARVA